MTTRLVVMINDYEFGEAYVSGIYNSYEKALNRFYYEIGVNFASYVGLCCHRKEKGFDLSGFSKDIEDIDCVDGHGRPLHIMLPEDLNHDRFIEGLSVFEYWFGNACCITLKEEDIDDDFDKEEK